MIVSSGCQDAMACASLPAADREPAIPPRIRPMSAVKFVVAKSPARRCREPMRWQVACTVRAADPVRPGPETIAEKRRPGKRGARARVMATDVVMDLECVVVHRSGSLPYRER